MAFLKSITNSSCLEYCNIIKSVFVVLLPNKLCKVIHEIIIIFQVFEVNKFIKLILYWTNDSNYTFLSFMYKDYTK